jgi:hypothetical protein
MGFENTRQNQGGGYRQSGGRPGGQKCPPWNKIHQQMFAELFAHPRMPNTKTEAKLRKWQQEAAPSNDMKSWLVGLYAEWIHQPRKDVTIRMQPDNGRYGQPQGEGSEEPPPQQAAPPPRQAPPRQQQRPAQRPAAPSPPPPPLPEVADEFGYANDPAPAQDSERAPWE